MEEWLGGWMDQQCIFKDGILQLHSHHSSTPWFQYSVDLPHHILWALEQLSHSQIDRKIGRYVRHPRHSTDCTTVRVRYHVIVVVAVGYCTVLYLKHGGYHNEVEVVILQRQERVDRHILLDKVVLMGKEPMGDG